MIQSSFLQSAEWEEIQRQMGRETKRIGDALFIRHDLPFSFHYWYSPHPDSRPGIFFHDAARALKSDATLFLKTDPILPDQSFIGGVRTRPLQPQETILLACEKSEAELLAAMHPKTRYNIRVASRHGVTARGISREALSEELQKFSTLLTETAARDKFHAHPQNYYQKLCAPLSEAFENELWVAEYRSEPLAYAVVNWFKPARTVTYLHGASSGLHREVMAPQFLHWNIIQEAKKRGFMQYDLGGIDEERWPGITRFKSGFGGKRFVFGPSHEASFQPLYFWLYRAQRRVRGRD